MSPTTTTINTKPVSGATVSTNTSLDKSAGSDTSNNSTPVTFRDMNFLEAVLGPDITNQIIERFDPSCKKLMPRETVKTGPITSLEIRFKVHKTLERMYDSRIKHINEYETQCIWINSSNAWKTWQLIRKLNKAHEESLTKNVVNVKPVKPAVQANSNRAIVPRIGNEPKTKTSQSLVSRPPPAGCDATAWGQCSINLHAQTLAIRAGDIQPATLDPDVAKKQEEARKQRAVEPINTSKHTFKLQTVAMRSRVTGLEQTNEPVAKPKVSTLPPHLRAAAAKAAAAAPAATDALVWVAAKLPTPVA